MTPSDVPAERAPAPPPAPSPRWLVLPNVAYDADDRLGLGARAELVFPDAERQPYRSAWVVHAFATTNGYHHHRFRFDRVGLPGRDELRLTGHFAFRAWLHDGYWGIGNATRRSEEWDGPFEEDDPRRDHYRYSLVQPFGQLMLRRDFASPVAVFGALNGRWSRVETYAGSLLEDERPYGMDGGAVGQVTAGILWDTRAPETSPSRGWLLEASGRVVTGAYTFAGPFLSARAWMPLAGRVVLGQRVMGEWLFGEVPFYEMVHWGGSVPIAGFGGADTLRGVPFGRWRGPGKAVANTELRVDVIRHRALGEELRWQVVPFIDVGTVFGTDDPFGVHPAGGAGIRIIWADTMVGRIDVGGGPDLGDDPSAFNLGTYLVFDHMF